MDKTMIKMEMMDGSNEKDERGMHHRNAEAGQSAICEAIKVAKQDKSVHVITLDLQQTMPTPKLTTGSMFYKPKLWCYIILVFIHAERVNDIFFCVMKQHLKGDQTRENKKWTLVAFWLYLLKSGHFKPIENTFSQVGHSMLLSDRDFAQVEKNVTSHYQMVYGPDHWQEVLRTSQWKNPF
ncbi:hypothetical protein PR048_017525, partial [Dryococelus australis]